MPFDGDTRAAYALIHPDDTVEHRRVEYDVAATRRARSARSASRGPRPSPGASSRPASTSNVQSGVTAEIEFIKGESTRYRSLLHRPDGVVVEFDGGSYNKVPDRLPHDIAHLIVEDELRLTCGVWGVLVAGGLFPQAHAVQGRRPPHASERARTVTRAAGDRLTQAEMLTGAVCHIVREGLHPRGDAMKRAAGDRWWTDTLTPEALERCRVRLRAAAKDWASLPAGGTFSGRWDHAVDPALAVGSRGADTRRSRSRRAARAAPRPLDDDDRARIAAGRAVVEAALAEGTAVYGVTTGFGQLAAVRIAPADAAQLQLNLLRSHAVGSGPPLAEEIVRGMLLLLASSLRRGHSGVRGRGRRAAAARCSSAASRRSCRARARSARPGDLAPLAHLALVLIGEGEATVGGERAAGRRGAGARRPRAGRARPPRRASR